MVNILVVGQNSRLEIGMMDEDGSMVVEDVAICEKCKFFQAETKLQMLLRILRRMDGVYIASSASGPSMLWFLNLSHTIADVPVQFRINSRTQLLLCW